MRFSIRSTFLALTLLAACRPGTPATSGAPDNLGDGTQLPTGRTLDPEGRTQPIGTLPLAILRAPDSGYVVVLSGFGQQGAQVVNSDGTVRQTLPQAAAFVGAVFAPDGKTLWAVDPGLRVQRLAGRPGPGDSQVPALVGTERCRDEPDSESDGDGNG